MERVYSIPESSLRDFLCVSGLDGIFTKPFRTMDSSQETNTRICWLSDLVCVNDPMKRIDPVKESTLGLEVGARGLGARVFLECCEKAVKELLSEALAELEKKRVNQNIYEIRSVPPWVDFEMREQMQVIWAW